MPFLANIGRFSDRFTVRFLDRSHTSPQARALNSDQLGFLRKSQLAAILSLTPAMMLANIINSLALVFLEYQQSTLTLATAIWCILIQYTALRELHNSQKFKPSIHRIPSQRAPGKVVVSAFFLALIWSYPALFLLDNSTPLEMAFIACVTAGMIGGGALALYPIPLAALVYSGVLTILSWIAILIGPAENIIPFSAIFIAFIVIMFYSILHHAGLFLSELIGKLKAEQQTDMVNLLLGSYEGDGGHCLWQCDSSLNLTTDPVPLLQMLGISNEDCHSLSPVEILKQSNLYPYDAHSSDVLARLFQRGLTGIDHLDITVISKQNSILKIVGSSDAENKGVHNGFRGYIKDITIETRSKEDAHRLATRDRMTNLLNYSEFVKRGDTLIEHRMTQSRESCLLFLFIDADNLKSVNDNFGHAVGDKLISVIAKRLRNSLPKDTLLSRKGGDEFLVLVECADEFAAEKLCQSSLEILNQSFLSEKRKIPLSCCIGARIVPRASPPLQELELEADWALYSAKAQGRRNLRIYDREIGTEIRRDRVLSYDLNSAMGKGELHLHFQPIVALYDETIVGSEALLRWMHPEFGNVSPEKIVSLAAIEGKSSELTEYVLRSACTAALSWPDRMFVSVNVSSSDLGWHGFSTRVLEILDMVGFPTERLWLEMTEAETIKNSSVVFENLNALREAGVTVAIDDFGTGYSSLSLLEGYSFDVIKIDRSLISGCNTRESSRIILKSIKALAATNSFQVVAEGVETRGELGTVKAAGIKNAQGFLFSEPLTECKLAEILTEQQADRMKIFARTGVHSQQLYR